MKRSNNEYQDDYSLGLSSTSSKKYVNSGHAYIIKCDAKKYSFYKLHNLSRVDNFFAFNAVMDATVTTQSDSLTVRIDQYQFTLGLRLDGLDIVLMYNNTEMLRVTNVYLLPQIVLPESLSVVAIALGGIMSLMEAALEQAMIYGFVHEPTAFAQEHSLLYLYINQYIIMTFNLLFMLLEGIPLAVTDKREYLDYLLGFFVGQAGMLFADLSMFVNNLVAFGIQLIPKNPGVIESVVSSIMDVLQKFLERGGLSVFINLMWDTIIRDKKIKTHVHLSEGTSSIKKFKNPFMIVLFSNYFLDLMARASILSALTSEAMAGNVLPILNYGRFHFLLNTLIIMTLRVPLLMILQLAIHSLMTELGV